jgi:hypothetical protein
VALWRRSGLLSFAAPRLPAADCRPDSTQAQHIPRPRLPPRLMHTSPTRTRPGCWQSAWTSPSARGPCAKRRRATARRATGSGRWRSFGASVTSTRAPRTCCCRCGRRLLLGSAGAGRPHSCIVLHAESAQDSLLQSHMTALVCLDNVVAAGTVWVVVARWCPRGWRSTTRT